MELPEICASSDVIWADSPFNAAELGTLGFAAEVLELPIDPQRWDLPRNEGVFNIVRGMQELHLLHVGRLAPNKCIEDIIKSFYFLYTHITKKSRLWLVGIDTDTELYSFSLRDLTQRLGIEHAVEFRGCMADEEVRAMYEACSVYVCMSEHEGFCLPIIEAMHFGLPVIGYGAGAVPDTIGAGGVIVREKRYAEMAQLMYELAKPGELRSKVIEAGRLRVQDFSYDRFTARLAELDEQRHGARVDPRLGQRARAVPARLAHAAPACVVRMGGQPLLHAAQRRRAAHRVGRAPTARGAGLRRVGRHLSRHAAGHRGAGRGEGL